MIIKQTDPLSSEAGAIIGKLTNELAERYNEPGGGAFNPEDVLVPRSIFLTGVESGKIIACGALRPIDDDTCEVKRMYVNPDYRGKGFAGKILAELEEKAKQFGYKKVILETGKRQPEALGLYNKSGYSVIPNYGIYKEREMSVCFEKILLNK